MPVAAFARGAIPEILDARCGVLAVPDDVASLAEAGLAALALDRRDCRKRAETLCDAERMVDNYEALYRQQICRAEQRNMQVPPTLHARLEVVPFRSRTHG